MCTGIRRLNTRPPGRKKYVCTSKGVLASFNLFEISAANTCFIQGVEMDFLVIFLPYF